MRHREQVKLEDMLYDLVGDKDYQKIVDYVIELCEEYRDVGYENGYDDCLDNYGDGPSQ